MNVELTPLAESSTQELKNQLAIALEAQNYVVAGAALVLLERRTKHYPEDYKESREISQGILFAKSILSSLSFGARNCVPVMGEMIWFLRPRRLKSQSQNLLTGRVVEFLTPDKADGAPDGTFFLVEDAARDRHMVISDCCYPLAIAPDADQMLDLLEFQEEVHHNQYFSPDITALSLEALDLESLLRVQAIVMLYRVYLASSPHNEAFAYACTNTEAFDGVELVDLHPDLLPELERILERLNSRSAELGVARDEDKEEEFDSFFRALTDNVTAMLQAQA